MKPTPSSGPSDPSLDPIIRVFQPRTSEPISRDRAVAMRSNLFGFFRELLDWKHADEEAAFRAAGGAK